jgi:Flp pilus assembly protein TadG
MNTSRIFRSRFQRRSRRGDEGQALAEMAIVLPILMLLVFGIIEMSNAWRTFQVVTNSAREGARTAILPGTDVNAIEDRVRRTLEGGGLIFDQANITIECIGANGNPVGTVCSASDQEARIGIGYPFTFQVLGVLADLVPITITSTTAMRNE